MATQNLSLLISDVFTLKKDMQEVKKRIALLPTKDEFYTWMDRIHGKLTTMENNNVFKDRQITSNTERIEVLETDLRSLQKP